MDKYNLQQLKEKYRLDPAIVDAISQKIIKNNTLGITTSVTPKAIILGGQPGSGKSELITQAQDVLGKNTVVCNADDYRDQHPQAEDIKIHHEQYYPDITAEYSSAWNNSLREYCQKNRFNYILETTFSSGERMNETITEMCNNGYGVSVMLLSVNQHLSFLGTRIRYEAMRTQNGYGRMVSKIQHDIRYDAIIGTLEMVCNKHLYEEIYIFGRASRQKLIGTSAGLRRISLNSKDPLKDYINERNKRWSENDLRYFTSDILQLIKKMVLRNATNTELKEIFDVIELDKAESLLAQDAE